MPRATYAPIGEDEKGIFFRSPERIPSLRAYDNKTPLAPDILVRDGGIFVSNDGKGYLWITSGGPGGYSFSFKEVIPSDKFRLELKP